MSCDIKTIVVYEDSSFSVMARVHDGPDLVQADINSIEWAVYYFDDNSVHTAASQLTVSNVIYDTLQTDSRWTEDATGYNFRHDVAHAVLTDPSRDYRLEYRFTLAGGSEFYMEPVKVVVKPMTGS